ncbi:MAG: prolipoprotein diacylglyceryl transferase [Oscillospiraceae bacterium]|nr:prolipoprotein diacylglyceryl transferase [Oscillospiraceae bacterium]
MHIVSFPGLGIGEITINRVAFHIGSWPVYWYGIIIAIGFFLAILYCCRVAPRFGIKQDDVVDMLFFAVPIGIVGARLYYIIFYYSQFQKADGSPDFLQMLRIWDGGLAIYGGVIAAVATLLIFCLIRKIRFLAFADLGMLGFLIGQCVGRWGNFMNAEAYGAETTLPWRMGITTSNGAVTQYMEVHPTFFYESIWNLVGFLLLSTVAKKRRKFDGQIFAGYFLWYGIGRFWIEGLRTDSLYFFNTPIRVSQAVAILTALLALLFLIFHLVLKKHTPQQLWVNQVAAAADKQEACRVALVFPAGVEDARAWADGFHSEGSYTEEYAMPEDASPDAVSEILITLKERDDLTDVLVWHPDDSSASV